MLDFLEEVDIIVNQRWGFYVEKNIEYTFSCGNYCSY